MPVDGPFTFQLSTAEHHTKRDTTDLHGHSARLFRDADISGTQLGNERQGRAGGGGEEEEGACYDVTI